ncbi:MAG: extracellular solute-binding protein [Fibrobacteres bacterium]|nr:extracellular solute-binding protein [Fibrobacterota bacterium]
MTQLDAFFIHGDDAGIQAGYLDDPDDLGFAVMPKGISMALNGEGAPLLNGTNAVTTGGWWWGIPKDTPDKDLSMKLVEWILSSSVQAEEASQFGMVPVRKDILGDISLLFGRTWIADVYNTSLKQLVHNKYNTVPLHREYGKIEAVYLDAFDDIVIKGNSGPSNGGMQSYIRKVLDKYQTQIQAVKE